MRGDLALRCNKRETRNVESYALGYLPCLHTSGFEAVTGFNEPELASGSVYCPVIPSQFQAPALTQLIRTLLSPATLACRVGPKS
jgi:hypothetical protein